MGKKDDKEVSEHQLYISSLSHWWTLRTQNKRSSDKKKRKHFRKIFWFSLVSAPFRWFQLLVFSRRIKKISFDGKPPVFVIGHWRSGTTHLHYTLAKDKRFSYLDSFQGYLFRVSLVSGKVMRPLMNALMPATRPQDNIKISADSPVEEEHPLTNLTEKCGMMSWFFPQNESYFDKYNLAKGVSKKEQKQWKRIYHRMLQTISYYNGGDGQLLLKNPHNTSRIKVLLELYPDAKFIHIHRNPYEVYNSTVHLWKKAVSSQFLQDYTEEQMVERVYKGYEEVMQKFLDDVHLVPEGNFVEVAYHEFAGNELSELERIYKELNLSGFDQAKPKFEAYLETVKGYKRNKFVELSEEERNTINTRWKFAFDKWNYQIIEHETIPN